MFFQRYPEHMGATGYRFVGLPSQCSALHKGQEILVPLKYRFDLSSFFSLSLVG